MTRIVFVTQHADPAHPALAATVPKVAALAARVDEVVVFAASARMDALPPNVRFRSYAAATRPGRGLRFAAALGRELGGGGVRAVVAHMCPIYAILAAPLARPLGVPVVLWFTHWRGSRQLRLAERLATVVASVDRRSFPLESAKVRPLGHGISLDDFPCRPPGAAASFRLLAVGRYSPAKGLDTVLRAVRLAVDSGLDVRLRAAGPSLTAEERDHRADLGRRVDELGLAERVVLEGPVPRSRLAALFADADALVNNMLPGALDKIVYEASAGCLPVLASNPGFDLLYAGIEPSLAFARDDAEELVARIRSLAGLDAERRAEIGRELRRRVEESHSVEAWAAGLLAAAGLP